MRKILVLLLVASFVFSASEMIYATIEESPHDWSYLTGKADPGGAVARPWRRKETQICRPCHVVHRPSIAAGYTHRLLWQQSGVVWGGIGPLSYWSSTDLWWTVGMETTTAPGQVGFLIAGPQDKAINPGIGFCLSCHSDNAFQIGGEQYTFGHLTSVSGGFKGLTDHPIGIRYETWLSGLPGTPFETLVNVKLKDYKFFGAANDVIGCGTCHGVHGTDWGFGLHNSVTGSKVCLDCHKK